jgi:hypothetical protein
VKLDFRFVLNIVNIDLHFIALGNEGCMASDGQKRWIDYLSPEDLAFLKRFLLASGTLKQLATEYGISYPTIRLRLDRLIEKVRLIDEHTEAGPFELRLRMLYADGKVDDDTFRTLMLAHRSEAAER